jgi:hypothetical protein
MSIGRERERGREGERYRDIEVELGIEIAIDRAYKPISTTMDTSVRIPK